MRFDYRLTQVKSTMLRSETTQQRGTALWARFPPKFNSTIRSTPAPACFCVQETSNQEINKRTLIGDRDLHDACTDVVRLIVEDMIRACESRPLNMRAQSRHACGAPASRARFALLGEPTVVSTRAPPHLSQVSVSARTLHWQ